MVDNGLRPEHYLLDIGCGPLRGGVHFVRYLDSGHYYGVDKDAELLRAAREIELPAAGLEDRGAVLVQMDDFAFERLGRRFEFALAQSLFTHLNLNSIMRCLSQTPKALSPGGRLYATYFESSAVMTVQSVEHPRTDGPPIVSHFDSDPYHYAADTLAWAARSAGLAFERVGDWRHPRGQMMAVFKP